MKRDGKKRPVDHGQPKGKKRPVDHGQPEGAKAQRARDFSVRWIDPWTLSTPFINNDIYGKVADDPGLDALAESIRRRGVLAPIAVNRAGRIISGNRRTAAACRAGLKEVPCFVWDIDEREGEFTRLLVEANENRVKDAGAEIAERGMKGAQDDPAMWFYMQRRRAERRELYGGIAAAVEVSARKRKAITNARGFADAVISAVNAELYEGITPTVRQIHYRLLNDPPVKDSRTGARYANDDASYKSLVNIAARLRVFGEISFGAIIDAGRELYAPQTYTGAGDYAEAWLNGFGGDYRRNVMRSQGAFYVVAVEKEAMGEFFRRHVAQTYPGAVVMVCRGYASLALAYQVRTAFDQSGKERLVILAFSDCDPAGGGIVADLGAKMLELGLGEDDFTLARCGLTHEQAKAHGARPQPMKAKGKGGETKARKFEREHGTREVYELEAIPPKELLNILDAEMTARMDRDAYEAELAHEERDAQALRNLQGRLFSALAPDA